jgi:hypothetical protein
MYSRNESDIEKIKEFCFKNASKFYFAEEWINQRDIANLLPSKSIDPTHLFFTKQVLRLQDSTNVYLLRIDELIAKGEIAPCEYVVNDIRQIILQERTQQLLKTIRNKIYGDALKNNIFEIYNK